MERIELREGKHIARLTLELPLQPAENAIIPIGEQPKASDVTLTLANLASTLANLTACDIRMQVRNKGTLEETLHVELGLYREGATLYETVRACEELEAVLSPMLNEDRQVQKDRARQRYTAKQPFDGFD